MNPLARQLRWYIAIRLVAVVSVLLTYGLLQFVWTPAPEIEPGAAPSTSAPAPSAPPPPPAAVVDPFPAGAVSVLAVLSFGATLLYVALLRLLRNHLQTQAYIQFFGDLVLITFLVYYLGGITSPFSLLYLIVIAVAATLLRRRAGLIVASFAFILYGGLAVCLFNGWLPPAVANQEAVPGWRVAYNLVVHFVGFYVMALLTYTLAHKVARAEQQLEEKSEELADLQVVHRDVIQSISSGLITTDLSGVMTSVNGAGIEILGKDEAELVGTPIQGSGLFSAERWDAVTAASDERGKLRSEVELVRNGETSYIGFSISRLTDAFGHHRGYIVIFQNLTRWRRMQEELRVKDRMVAVGELAAGLAHEIGNPLAAISGSVQMLAASDQDTAERKLIEILLKESQRLDRTIKGFLRFARPKERSSEAFDIGRLLEENFELLKNSDEVSRRHRLELDLDPPRVRLFADPDQISQIFWNLARNSLRAMPGGGTLRISGRVVGDQYRFQVVDTGRGMTEEQRANLFHPFQTFFDGGTGIGMAIVYQIVQEHGGRLRVDSRPGSGTTITVELPTAGASVTLVSAEAPV
jgi:two-component system, NtrC family, sensor histidine kinase PilS